MIKRRFAYSLTVLQFALLALHAIWTEKRVIVEWGESGKTISISFLNHLSSYQQNVDWMNEQERLRYESDD